MNQDVYIKSNFKSLEYEKGILQRMVVFNLGACFEQIFKTVLEACSSLLALVSLAITLTTSMPCHSHLRTWSCVSSMAPKLLG